MGTYEGWSNMSRALLASWRFFRAQGGGIVGENALGALQLARAEVEAAARGLVFVWEEDGDDYDYDYDFSDHDHWCRKDCGIDHEVLICAVFTADDTRRRHCLASLGWIVDPSREYRRVIEAELALEALAMLDELSVAIAG